MAQFRFEATLPSCSVNKDLLTRLEHYCLENLPKLLGPTHEKTRVTYELSIHDALGTETLDGIHQYGPDLLPDSTTSVAIEGTVRHPGGDRATVNVAFARDRSSAKFGVRC